MIDDETRKALETHLAVQLARVPRFRLRELAKPHGADAARHAVAEDLTASLAFPFDIKASGAAAVAPSTPGMRPARD